MDVKIIPISREYREGWEQVDWGSGRKAPDASAGTVSGTGSSAPSGAGEITHDRGDCAGMVEVGFIVGNPYGGSWFGWVL